MGKIAQLDSQTTNMIAAGEVVERPMGVVKELVENAIDANATRIQISIEDGGLGKITITDNGCGMDSRDAEMCFERHATSKIHSQNELWTIHTLGFRGEALPSIASVAKVTLCTSDGKDATKVVIAYGKKEMVSPYPCNQGTQITVEGLFYQVPARLKHMRSGVYEASLIQDVLARFAFSHPEIAFHFINDGRDAMRTSGQGNLLEVVNVVYGRMAAENSIAVDFSDYDFHVSGYLIKPTINRASRNMMHIFLNGRMVRTYKLFQSVQDAYREFLPSGRYPMCVLSIEMDPHLLDVNVHPSKWEVRISKEMQLELLLKEEVHKALCNDGQVVEPVVEETKTEYYQPLSFDTEQLTVKKEEPATEPFVMNDEIKQRILEEANEDNEILHQLQDKIEDKKEVVEEQSFPLLEVIGQYKERYILASSTQGLAIIDQQAAKRRIEYEHLQKTLLQKPVMIDLLVPLTIHVNDTFVNRIDEINQAIQDMNLSFESFGNDTLILRRIPSWMKDIQQEEFINDLLDAFHEDTEVTMMQIPKKQIAILATKHCIEKHQKYNQIEMKEILIQLAQCENPWMDPTGHPTMIIKEEKMLLKGLK